MYNQLEGFLPSKENSSKGVNCEEFSLDIILRYQHFRVLDSLGKRKCL